MSVIIRAVVNKRRKKVFIELEDPSDTNLRELKRAFRFLTRKPKYDWQGEYWILHINDLPVLAEQGLAVIEEMTVE